MKKAREQSIHKRTIRALVIMAIMLVPVCVFMVLGGMRLAKDRESAQIKLKMDALAQLVDNENEMYNAAVEAFDKNLATHVNMMRVSLGNLISEDGYVGPRTLSDGFVVELRGDDVILPEGMPGGSLKLTRSGIEQSLASGKLRTGRFKVEEAASDSASLLADAQDAAEDTVVQYQPGEYYLSFGRIADSLVYVSMISKSMFDEVVNSYVQRNYTAVENENGGFGGITLVVNEQDGNVELLKAYGDVGAYDSLSDVGITPDQILNRTPLLIVNNTTYSCNYSTIQGAWDGWEAPVMIQMLPVVTIGTRSLVQSAIISYVMVLILVNIIVYVMSVQRHVRDHVITEAQAARYTPKRLRIRMTNAAVIGTIAIFVIALIVQGVGQLYIELRYGQDTLRVFSKQLEQEDHRQNDILQRIQEDWYVYYGEHMASLLTACPSLATSGMLQNWCDILSVDFIMLFDGQGKETLCSRDYVGFTLDRGLGQKGSEFRRLLYGLSSIVHEPSVDSTTGMERQMIGVKLDLPNSSGGEQHGALIMALLPEQTRQTENLFHINEQLAQLEAKGTLCFNADASSGVIRFSGDAKMAGQAIQDCGLSENSLRDGYMDFMIVNGVRRFIVTLKQDSSVFYYALDLKVMFGHTLAYAGITAVLFALAVAVVLVNVFRDYNDKVYAAWAVVRMPGEDSQALLDSRKEARPAQEKPGGVKSHEKHGTIKKLVGKLVDKVSDTTQWRNRTPEDKANLMFQASMLVLLVSWASLLLSKNIVYSKYDSLAGFLLRGDWMRGANLFAFCSIFLVIAYAYLINLLSRGILTLISGFLLGKGQTFCRLLYSFVKYFSLFVVLYLILHYLGFPIGTVVGSLSIASLALSLGAKDLAADILAGLSIVFERAFQVGDIVEINGKQGTVQEIGMRSTKLIVPVNNVLVISNHEIRDILNLTQDVSMYQMALKVRLSQSLTDTEAVLKRELASIQRGNERIISLRYLGVTALGGGLGEESASLVTLAIGAYCRQEDIEDIELYLKREIRLMCERENIRIG